MNINPNALSREHSPGPIQAHLRFNLLEIHNQIPAEKRVECVALLRELIEVVAGLPSREAGGAND